MTNTDLGLPLFDLTNGADIAALLNSLSNAVNTLLKSPWKSGTGTITIPSGAAGVNADLVVPFLVTFATAPKVSIWSRDNEAFTLAVATGSTTTTQFTANIASAVALGASHNVPFGWAVVDSPWQNPYS